MPPRATTGSPPAGQGEHGGKAPPLVRRLYVAASAPNLEQATANLRALLARAKVNDVALEIIDCIRDPVRALQDGVVVTPMLIKVSPEPPRSIVGTLRDAATVAHALGIADRLPTENGDE